MGMDGNSMMLLGTAWLMRLAGRQAGARLATLLLLLQHSSGSFAAPVLPRWDGRAAHLLPLECAEIPIPGVFVQWLEQAHPPLPSALLW